MSITGTLKSLPHGSADRNASILRAPCWIVVSLPHGSADRNEVLSGSIIGG